MVHLLVLLAATQVDVEKNWTLELKPQERILSIGDAGILVATRTESSDPAVAMVPWETGTPRWTHAWDPKHGELPTAELDGDRVAVFSGRRVWLLDAESADVLLEESLESPAGPAGVLRADGLHVMTHRQLRLYDRDGRKQWEASAGKRTIERWGGKRTEYDNAILSREVYEDVTVLVAGYFDKEYVERLSPLYFRVAHENGAVTPYLEEVGRSVSFDADILISPVGAESLAFSTASGKLLSKTKNPESGKTADGRILYDTPLPWRMNGRISFESGGRLYAILGSRWGATAGGLTRVVDLGSGKVTLELDTTMMTIVGVGDGAAVWTRRLGNSRGNEGLIAFDLKNGKRRWSLDVPVAETVLTDANAVALVERDGVRLLVVDLKDGSIQHESEAPPGVRAPSLWRVPGMPLVGVAEMYLLDPRDPSFVEIPRPAGGFVSTFAHGYRLSPDRRHVLYGTDKSFTAYTLTVR